MHRTDGYREQIWIASIASAAGIGLMLTTILPPNGPALLQSILVRHIDVDPFADISDLDARGDQRFLEGKGAPQCKSHPIILPELDDIVSLPSQHAFMPDAILWHVGPDIDIDTQFG